VEGVIMLAPEIIDNGALSKLIWGGDSYYHEGRSITPEPAILEVGMTEANFSNKNLGVGGAIVISAWLTHRDKRALSSANLLGNDIGIEQASALAVILKEHPTLKSLYGNKGDETELDMSGKNIRVEGAIMLVPEIIDN
jgi:hypothetical protein